MSKIEWTDISWNPATGCDPISPGCDNCYASRMAARLFAMGQEKYKDGFEFRFHPDELTRDLGAPKKVFVCSMSDLFHKKNYEHNIRLVLGVIRRHPAHLFQILTKRPENAYRMDIDWPKNVIFGITAENGGMLAVRSPYALNMEVRRFISFEPLLCDPRKVKNFEVIVKGFDWLIVGPETGPGRRPFDLEWARFIRDVARRFGIPFFFKPSDGPADLMIKEFPVI